MRSFRTLDPDAEGVPDEVREAVSDQFAGNDGGYYELEIKAPPARGYSNASNTICAYLLKHGATVGETVLIHVWG